MTSADQNLHVVTDHIAELAGRQHAAADKITGANRAIVEVADHVLKTHGALCALTSLALGAVDSGRKAAGAALYSASDELAQKLETTEANYENTDYLAKRSLGRACEV